VKLALMLLSLSLGVTAAVKTVQMMDAAAAVLQASLDANPPR
jgi:hypothetical protein